MNPFTKEQTRAALDALLALAEAIQALGRVPSGHLYARVMSVMSLESYNAAIGCLKKNGLVKEVAHELIWIGPAVQR